MVASSAVDAGHILRRRPGRQGDRFEYDALNRLSRTTSPSGQVRTIDLNLDGTQKSFIDDLGARFEFGYDELGQLGTVQQSDGNTLLTTRYGFDSVCNNITREDAEGRVTRWGYDSLGRVVARTLPGGQVERFKYDSVGNVVERAAFDGRSVVATYDQLGQPTLVVRPDGVRIGRAYTRSGQLESVTVTAPPGSGVESGTTTFIYDAQDRLIRRQNPDGAFLAYGYDAVGNIVERSTAAGTVRYGFDAAGRMQTVADMNGGTTRYDYDKAGRLAAIRAPNGVMTSYSYDDDGRLLQVAHADSGGKLLGGVRYTLSAGGLRVRADEFDDSGALSAGVMTGAARSVVFGYDQASRLVSETLLDRGGQPTIVVGYTYDRTGNRISKTEQVAGATRIETYLYDQNDRLRQVEMSSGTGNVVLTSYEWDENGNLRLRTQGGEKRLYKWNSDNRLIEVARSVDGAPASMLASYTYDFNGNRIAKALSADGSNSSLRRYLIDELFPYAQVVHERVTDAGGGSENTYTWGLHEIGQRIGGVPAFTHADGGASVRLLTDAAGIPVVRLDYDAFGTPRASAGSAVSAYQFAGEYRDETIGMQYHRLRWYQPELGRFASMDVVDGLRKQPVTQNKYVYAGNNPVSFQDPSGAFALSEVYFSTSASISLASAVSYTHLTSQLLGRLVLHVAASAIGTYTVVDMATKKHLEDCMKSNSSSTRSCKPDFGMYILGDNHYEVRDHVSDAVSEGHPSMLSRKSGKPSRKWLYSAGGGRCVRTAGMQCDEYPFGFTMQGGKQNGPSLRMVNGSQNMGAGAVLGNFYQYCKLPSDQYVVKYKVLALRGVTSGYVCSR